MTNLHEWANEQEFAKAISRLDTESKRELLAAIREANDNIESGTAAVVEKARQELLTSLREIHDKVEARGGTVFQVQVMLDGAWVDAYA